MPGLQRTAWIEIDIAALLGNVAAIIDMSGGLPVMPVVKADAYGHGMVPVARILEGAGVAALCVATLDEARVLREAAISVEILVLYPIPPGEVDEAARLAVTIAAGPSSSTAAVLSSARSAGVVDRLRFELEVETGLGRGGATPEEVVEVARAIMSAGATLSGVWSHLQEADVVEITAEQVRRYEAALAALDAAGIAVPRRHLAASSAILLAAVPRYDAVRPGLVTYGLIPDELLSTDDPTDGPGTSGIRRGAGLARAANGSSPKDSGTSAAATDAAATHGVGARPRALVAGADRIRPVLSLHARPVRVAQLPVGHGVSYGPTWRARRRSTIATLPVGYGDGWPRLLSNRGIALVRGIRVPVVGNVAMDATMIDVTDVPGPPVGLADEFVLLGRQGSEEVSAALAAQWRTTNSWEVVTSMSARLTRVYDAPAGIAGTRNLSPLESSWRASSSGTATSATSRSTRS